ncbi:MAG TPA: hypothetical protein VL992_08080 [Tepidisphaeraceae bacterium]|nr:hypothetical protein [Tepidisphaeraceae bacterium]
MSNGATIDGWEIVYPANLSLVSEDTPTLTLEETGAFDSLAPLDLLFVQASYTASPTITISSETLTNNVGQLKGVKNELTSVLAGNTASPSILSTFSLTNPNNSTFSRQTIGNTYVTFRGTFNKGSNATLNNGDLVISANPVTSGIKKIFFLHNEAVPAVPLPPAVWTGLSGLLGLGLISGLRKLRQA